MKECFSEKPSISKVRSTDTAKQVQYPTKAYLENLFPTSTNPRPFLQSPTYKSQKDILFKTVTNGMIIKKINTPASPILFIKKDLTANKFSPAVFNI